MKIILELPKDMPILAELTKEGVPRENMKAHMLELIKAEISKHQGTDLVSTPYSVEIQLNGKSPKEPD
jgi:hypothetical protein